jgi:dTDP-glucose pyrophosphorylase
MKTPMQEMFDQLKASRKDEYGLAFAIDMLLEKERKVIEDAHIEGQRVFDNYPHTEWTNHQAEQYYNETFNTKE